MISLKTYINRKVYYFIYVILIQFIVAVIRKLEKLSCIIQGIWNNAPLLEFIFLLFKCNSLVKSNKYFIVIISECSSSFRESTNYYHVDTILK